MRIFQAECMREKRHAPSHALPASPPGVARATYGCLAVGGRFDPLFPIVIYNEQSILLVVRR